MSAAINYNKTTFPSSRLSTIDICALGLKKHHVAALLEIDITQARARLRAYRAKNGESLSFTAWVIRCVAAAAAEYPQVAAYRAGRRTLAAGGAIDVAVTVEKRACGYDVPLPLVLRDCAKRSVADLHGEIRSAQAERADSETIVLKDDKVRHGSAVFYRLPAFLRRFVWRAFLLRPKTALKTMGSVCVTSVGMCGVGDGWCLPIGIHPLIVAIGSVTKKPGVINDKIVVREYLKLTALVDHDVIDGAPAARFISRLTALMKAGDGLDSAG